MKQIYYATLSLFLSLHAISIVKVIQNQIYEMETYDKFSLVDNISMVIIIVIYIIYIVDILRTRKYTNY